MDNLPEDVGRKLEDDYVKSTYDSIAREFSSTRYKKWPKVDAFLTSLPQDSLLLDVGCGNGKYLDNKITFNIGCDISKGLLSICKSRGFEVVQCDMTKLPFRSGVFDAMICIAALHHIVGEARRQKCLQDMTHLLSPEDGKFLVQVWSYEQELHRDNPYLRQNHNKVAEAIPHTDQVSVSNDVYLPIHKNRTPFVDQDVLVPFQTKQSEDKSDCSGRHLRFYHVFKCRELDSMIGNIDGVRVSESYYDKGNWCSVISKNANKI